MDPTIEEFCRAKELQLGPMRRMQRYFKDVIQPMLDERETLKDERDRLLDEVRILRQETSELKARRGNRTAAAV